MKFVIVLSVVVLSQVVLSFGDREERERAPYAATKKGFIIGKTFRSRKGKRILAFRGIRYAAAPINELRFQPPRPPPDWSLNMDATKDGPSCPQDGTLSPTDEDCLFLNIYTRHLPTRFWKPKRPVIVYFHSGAFVYTTGRSNWAGPEYFLDEDIVLVTLNYRLGALGFVSTGDKEAPGNLGLKDQVQALRWVKENIHYFGGDPDCVTIFGYSAGSASVMMHMMSPMSKGLYHRAISGSASPLGTWPEKTNQLNLVKQLARLNGCPDNSTFEMMKCLKTVPAQSLALSEKLKEFGYHPLLIWEPVVELDFGQERFLTDLPLKLATEGRFENVPLMTGITTEEFSYLAYDILSNETFVNTLNSDFNKYLPIILDYERSTQKSTQITDGLKKFYFNDKTIDNSSFTQLGQLLNDGLTGFGINRAAKVFSSKSRNNVYYYEFSYQGRYSHVYVPGTNNTVPYGVVHHDDLIYLFYISELFPKFTTRDPESKMVDKMIHMWANFAKFGKPIPKPCELLDNVSWDAFKIENGKYMQIGNTLQMKTGLYENRYKIWEDLLPLPQSSS